MSDDSGPWKVKGGNNNNFKMKTNNKNNNKNKMTVPIAANAFEDIDRSNEEFAKLSISEQNQKAKTLWGHIQKCLISIISSATDLQLIIQSLYQHLSPQHRNLIYTLPASPYTPILQHKILQQQPQHELHPQQQKQEQQQINPVSTVNNQDTPQVNTFIDYKTYIFDLLQRQQLFQTTNTSTQDRKIIANTIQNDNNTPGDSTSTSEPSQTSTSSTPSSPQLQQQQQYFNFNHVSFGIGNLSKQQSQFQFAFFLLFITCFPIITQQLPTATNISTTSQLDSQSEQNSTTIVSSIQPLIYDPMFTAVDKHLFKLLNITLLDNTEGRVVLPQQTLVNQKETSSTSCVLTKNIIFIPHCPVGISHNTLQSLWHDLPNTIILANSFTTLVEKVNLPISYYTNPKANNKKKGNNNNNSDQIINTSLYQLAAKELSQIYQDYNQRNVITPTAPSAFTKALPMLPNTSNEDKILYLRYGLEQHAQHHKTLLSTPEQQNVTTTTPALGLLLSFPWLAETPINYSPNNGVLNDTSIHSFPLLQPIITETNNNNNNNNNAQIVSKLANLLHQEGNNLPHYTPPLSSNPELIPTSLRQD